MKQQNYGLKDEKEANERMTSELELRVRLEQHGYELVKLTHFKNHDRIIFQNENIRINMNLKSKISQVALDTLIDACVGSGYTKRGE